MSANSALERWKTRWEAAYAKSQDAFDRDPAAAIGPFLTKLSPEDKATVNGLMRMAKGNAEDAVARMRAALLAVVKDAEGCPLGNAACAPIGCVGHTDDCVIGALLATEPTRG